MDELEEIREKIDIVDFINQYVPLKRAGRNFKALCPFHSEKTPSFIVSPERQIWHCFGACNEGGDIFSFLMKWEGLEFYEALKILAKKAGVKLKKGKWVSGKAKEKEKIYEINHLASEFYHFLLTSHRVGRKALDYLLARGIKRESIKNFDLGYAPLSWRSILPFLRKKGYEEEEIEKAGLIVKAQNYYDRFRGRIIFPLKDHRGNIVGFSGRVLNPNVTEAKYINTPETLLYHKSQVLYGLDLAKKAIREAKNAIITEGEFDVISSFQVGIKNIVAIKGSALTEDQVRLLKRFSSNITLALDADLAGDQACRRGIEIADKEGLFVKVIKLPKGSDPDDLIKKGVEFWKKAVKSPIPVYDFFLSSSFSRLKGESPEEKREIAKELLPIWAKITDPIVKGHYIKILAEKLGVSQGSIVASLAKIKEEKEIEENPVFSPEKSREEILEEYFLALLLKTKKIKKILADLFEENFLGCLKTQRIKKIIKMLKDFLNQKEKLDIASFAKTLPSELLPTLDLAYLKNVEENFKKEEVLEKELLKVSREIKKLFIKRRLKILANKIKEKAARDEFKKLTAELKDLEKKW